MTPLQQQHLEYIQSEVIPMTDEQRAADHAEISVRFAIEHTIDYLKNALNWVRNKDLINSEIERLEKTLNKGCGK
jgi:hypothetical protein